MEKSIKKLCYLALFCAIAIVLSYIESLIPLYLGVPGAKLGLASRYFDITSLFWLKRGFYCHVFKNFDCFYDFYEFLYVFI